MHALPDWCRPPGPLPEREALLAQALEALDQGVLTLTGPASAGTTTVAGALLQALHDNGRVQRMVAVRVHPGFLLPDLVRALGLAAGAGLPGDEAAVGEALAAVPTAILVDDADLAPDMVQRGLDLAPQALWVLTGREGVGGPTVRVAPGPPPNWRLPEPVPPELRRLACLPLGVPDGVFPPLPPELRVPGEARVLLRRAVREALVPTEEGLREALTVTMHQRAAEAHEVACDLRTTGQPEDVAFFRTAAPRLADPDLASLAAAAAARLSMRFFEPSEALRISREALAEHHGRPVTRGLLHWLEGDALLEQGLEEQAWSAHRRAAHLLAEARASGVLATLARRCAERAVARGDAPQARQWLNEARSHLDAAADPAAWADTLRIAAGLAAQGNELVGAAALYDEARAAANKADQPTLRAAIRVGQAAVELARGQVPVAEERLKEAETEASDDPHIAAAIAWRQAEASLHRGRRAEARQALERARAGYRAAGRVRGLLLCARLAGDLAALEGDRGAAVEAWQQALALCVRTRDLAALRRVLRRMLAVEREGVPGPHLDELQECLGLAEILLRTR